MRHTPAIGGPVVPPNPTDELRDCVCEIPALSPDVVVLAGIDPTGAVQIKVEVPRDHGNLDDWHVWLLRYVRRHAARPPLELMG